MATDMRTLQTSICTRWIDRWYLAQFFLVAAPIGELPQSVGSGEKTMGKRCEKKKKKLKKKKVKGKK